MRKYIRPENNVQIFKCHFDTSEFDDEGTAATCSTTLYSSTRQLCYYCEQFVML